jgi:hypothetical protein
MHSQSLTRVLLPDDYAPEADTWHIEGGSSSDEYSGSDTPSTESESEDEDGNEN